VADAGVVGGRVMSFLALAGEKSVQQVISVGRMRAFSTINACYIATWYALTPTPLPQAGEGLESALTDSVRYPIF
jgi:hypothetical protein